MRLVSIPALLGHIVVMLTTCSVLAIVNLLTTPGTWWSFAVLAVWFALVAIHGIGLVSISVFLDEDDAERPTAPSARPEATNPPAGPPAPNWLTFPRPRSDRAEVPVPASWRLTEDGTPPSWPAPPAGPPAPKPAPVPERLPWRAATDIAWLRRPSREHGSGAGDDAARDDTSTGREVSS
jgi:hypothetical protein